MDILLCRMYGINVCGEGGEYETLTLDCPLFKVCLWLDFEYVIFLTDTYNFRMLG